jgi:hypothetical protein
MGLLSWLFKNWMFEIDRSDRRAITGKNISNQMPGDGNAM